MTRTDRTGPRAAFIVRGEQHGEAEALNFREEVCSIGWSDSPNPLTEPFATIQAHADRYWQPKDGTTSRGPRTVWRFAHTRALDHAVIVLPRLAPGHDGEVAIGLADGPAYWEAAASGTLAEPRLRRHVQWVTEDVLRSTLSAATEHWLKKVRITVGQVRIEAVARELRALAGVEALA
jgi:predicted Mrr-cat superfamily restriction endonuclease